MRKRDAHACISPFPPRMYDRMLAQQMLGNLIPPLNISTTDNKMTCFVEDELGRHAITVAKLREPNPGVA